MLSEFVESKFLIVHQRRYLVIVSLMLIVLFCLGLVKAIVPLVALEVSSVSQVPALSQYGALKVHSLQAEVYLLLHVGM